MEQDQAALIRSLEIARSGSDVAGRASIERQ
jgi:hypothetical protein